MIKNYNCEDVLNYFRDSCDERIKEEGLTDAYLLGKYEGEKEGYNKAINEFKEKMRNLNQLNCFIDYVADEIDLEELMHYASEEIAEQLKEQE